MSTNVDAGFHSNTSPPERPAVTVGDSQDLPGVITTIVAALADGSPERTLQAVFEEEVRRLLSMRSVRLREIPARYHARLVTPTRTADSIVLGVSTADPGTQGVLEASFDPERAPGGAECEVLVAIAQLGGLVLQAGRGRLPPPGRKADATEPLVGSTAAMHQLRMQVERVALTDFTLLVEGAMRR